MKYRRDPKNGNLLSALGYGCMRFTRNGEEIDQEKAEKEMLYALEHGVNYFDTAYTYPGCEVALGKFLAKGHRNKVFLTSKLPHSQVQEQADLDRLFYETLRRLQTDHIDYYLIHMLTNKKGWQRLLNHGVEDWVVQKKKSGEIRNLGFSFHGNSKDFLEIIDAYDWDFCQIQYNYIDIHSQGGVTALRYAANKGLPVMIMEPLLGGKLAGSLPEAAADLFAQAEHGWSPAEWGLRWLLEQPEVTVILSGMNALSQVEENVRVCSQAEPGELQSVDFAVYDAVRSYINRNIKVGCTACGYCLPCPQGVNIPLCFRCYNNCYVGDYQKGLQSYKKLAMKQQEPMNASRCIQCGLCEEHCPQSLNIRRFLLDIVEDLEKKILAI